MKIVMELCRKSLEGGGMTLWPSKPIASSEVTHHPGLVQCLALADAKQCDAMVQSCLSHLNRPGTTPGDIIYEALSSKDLGKLLDGLRSETKSAVIRSIVGHRTDFQVNVV
jgi:hypothetical protein